jgi:hypothetical protein
MDCVEDELAAIFETGNKFKQAIFIVGLPETWIAVLADCGYQKITGDTGNSIPLGSIIYVTPNLTCPTS